EPGPTTSHSVAAAVVPDRGGPAPFGDRGQASAAAGTTDALRQSDQELPAGAVRLLRDDGPAADQQRPGTSVWQSSLPRTARERPQGGIARFGGAGVGAGGGRVGDTAAARRGLTVTGGLCGSLAANACGPGEAPGSTTAATAVPARSGRLPA